MGLKSKQKRVIFLVDMNAFYISCEMVRNPALKGKPAAVAGDPERRSGIILAANYEARGFGVKTTMVLHEALKLCPNLVLVPPDGTYYEAKSRQVMEMLSRYSPVIQQNSIDEAWVDMSGCEGLFGKPAEAARRMMDAIRNELGLWCSIGISENKFLAKMASERKKPQGITEIWQKDVREKLWPLPVREMYGIGAKTEKKLSSLSIFTIGDLAGFDRGLLTNFFGKYGEELHRLSHGIDDSPVTANPTYDSRSISRSTTLPQDITDLEYAKTVLLKLAEEVGAEARKAAFKGKTVSVIIKYGDFHTITRQKAVDPTYLTREIYKTAGELLKSNWNPSRPVRLLGVALGGSDADSFSQVSLFEMAGMNGKWGTVDRTKEEKLETAIDALRQKFGNDKIQRCSTVILNKKVP